MGGKKKSVFQRIVPKFIRKSISNYRIKKTILDYYNSLPKTSLNEEEQEALNYLKAKKLCVFPYSFQEKYNKNDVKVFKDNDLKLKYVLCDGKKMYFKRKSSSRGIKRNYNTLLIEQDISSPHRYLTEDFEIGDNAILVDVGAAEGNLALSVIEKVKKVFLFETDERWIEALEATFAPWKDKVEIINKFVSDKNDEKHVSLDQFFNDKENFTFLKVDAEGAEADILKGCETMLCTNQQVKMAICTYHKPGDSKEFNDFLQKKGFAVDPSKGYMIFNEPKTFTPPYLRRGIIRAKRLI